MLKIAASEIKAFEVPFNEKVVIYSMQTFNIPFKTW